jgi:hypothetical protein
MNLYDFITQNTDDEIDISTWKTFSVSPLFSIERPAARVSTSYDDGDIPFVASGNFNNGIEKYVAIKNGENLDKAGCITVSPVDGSAFYQKSDFLGRGGAGSSILILRNTNLNQWNALFICSVLRRIGSKFNYANMCSAKKLAKELLYLPILEDGNPNWKYMEDYIKSIHSDISQIVSIK